MPLSKLAGSFQEIKCVFYPGLVITHLRKLFSVATSLNIPSSLNLTPRPLAWFHPVRGEVIYRYTHKFFDTALYSSEGSNSPPECRLGLVACF